MKVEVKSIADLLRVKGISITDLAEILGYSRQTVYWKIENKSWKIEDIQAISKATGVAIQDVVDVIDY